MISKSMWFIILIPLLMIILFQSKSSTLNIVLQTSKPCYSVDENIEIYGNLTYNDAYVPNSTVAIEVQNLDGDPIVLCSVQTNSHGVYNFSFRLSLKARLGTYTVYVTSSYMGETAVEEITFEYILLGDINNDKTVNFLDAILLGAAFNSEPDDPNWNSNADINGDDVVNFLDAIILGVNFGKVGTL